MGTHNPLEMDNVVRPKTRDRGICFLHLPKTAGSFVVACFEERYGAENCAPFIEGHLVKSISTGTADPIAADFISAHASFHTLSIAGVRQRFDLFTILRDPVDRLVSHMNWMDRYNHRDRRQELRQLPKAHLTLLEQLKSADCHDVDSMRRFFHLDDLTKAQFLLNMQTGMVMDCIRKDILSIAALSQLPNEAIRKRLRKFRFVGQVQEFNDLFLAQTGFDPADLGDGVNKTHQGRFSRTPELERFCQPYVQADKRLLTICKAERAKGNLNDLVID
ncbi:sulfotransferase family 2 domain-containing protein [Aestuariibius insulae]|uniref:sulfotransferase family 2 domain-containing protein n=1 Tax=Aestuariibius insulae TaxID=2058287 RepID=UPI00345E40E8